MRSTVDARAVLLSLFLGLGVFLAAIPLAVCGECDTKLHSGSFFPALPAQGSPEWIAYVAKLRTAFFNRKASYAILDTSQYFSVENTKSFYNSMPHDSQSQINGDDILVSDKVRGVLVRPLSDQQQRTIKEMSDWIRGLINAAFGTDALTQRPYVNVRLSTLEDAAPRFEQWHLDGGAINILIPLLGTGTEILGPAPVAPATEPPPTDPHHNRARLASYYAPRGEHWEKALKKTRFRRIPRGRLWVFSGTAIGSFFDGARPTIHRSPSIDEERLILIIRFSI